MSSQFDALLDFGDDPPPSTNGTAQQANGGDDFDPFGPGPLDSGKGGGGDGGLLLDFSLSGEASSTTKNGTAADPFDSQFSLTANADSDVHNNTTSNSNNPFADMSATEAQPSSNPLYDLMDDDFSQQQASEEPPPAVNPLYDLSHDSDLIGETNVTTTTTVEESSSNPLYDFMDQEGEETTVVVETKTETTASSDLLDMDFGAGGGGGGVSMEKSTPSEDILVQSNNNYADDDRGEDQIVPDLATQEEAALPRDVAEEEEEAGGEGFDQNVELFIREEGEDQTAPGMAEVSDDVQQQQQQQQQEEVMMELVMEERMQQEEEVGVVETAPRSRSRSPSVHSISSEGEVINEVLPTSTSPSPSRTHLSFTSTPPPTPPQAVSSSSSRTVVSEITSVASSSSFSSSPSSSASVSAVADAPKCAPSSSRKTATTTITLSSVPQSTRHVGRSVALLRLSRGQPLQRTTVKTVRGEEQMRQDERAELQSREEEEAAEVKRRSYQETKTEEETVDTAAVGGLEQKEEDGLEEKQVTREQTPQKEDFHFQEMSSVKNQFEQQQQQAPPKETAQQRQEVSSAPQQSKPSTTLEAQWEDEPEEGVYENEPEQRADVVRETDRDIGAELPSVGTAKSMRDKFVTGKMENTPAEVKKEVTPPPAASNGGVFENEPKFNPDVIHAGDENQEVMPEQGTARNLAARFKEMEKEGAVPVPSRGKREITPDKTGKVEYVSEPRGHVEKYEPEVQAGIFESQPSERADVVKADELPEEILPEKGAAKNLAQRFKQMSTENTNTSTPRAKREITPDTSGRVEYVSEPTGFVEKYEGRTESGVFESQPADREGVVKSDSAPEDILPEQGTTRNIAARFKEMEKTTKSPPSPSKVKEFTPPRENGPATQSSGVYESSPQVASDVVHADDQVEEVMPEKGMAKSIANRFRQLSSGDATPAKSPRSKKEFTPPPGGSGVYENTPKQFVPDYNKPAESGILESKPESRSDVVRSEDPVPSSEQELPEQGYTKNLLSAWRQKESSASSAKASPPSSGKPKEFTPPREEPRVAQQRPAPRTPKSPLAGTDMNDGSVHPSDLPGQYQPQAEASVYESEPERREDVVREEDTDWQQGMPKPDTTKKMLAKFKHIQQQATSPTADTTPTKPKPTARKEGEESSADKVGRSKSMRVPLQLEKCGACQKTVYVMEKIEIEKHSYHKSCFRCSHCHCVLTPKTFAINNNVMFCTTHYKQLFATRGNYDEGFGRDQHKKRWKSEPNLADDELSSTGSAQH